MSFTDPISDMITRIRNAQIRTLNTVLIPNSKLRARILDVLKEEGYISDYKPSTNEKNNKLLFWSKIWKDAPNNFQNFLLNKKVEWLNDEWYSIDPLKLLLDN